MTRALPGQPAANPAERVSLADALRAYTIDGARAMGREREFGSITPGKSADFIEIDQDIEALARSGHADDIASTRVLKTWFKGRPVFAKPGA